MLERTVETGSGYIVVKVQGATMTITRTQDSKPADSAAAARRSLNSSQCTLRLNASDPNYAGKRLRQSYRKPKP